MRNKIKEVFSLFTEKEDFDQVVVNIESGIPFKGTNLWILIFAIFIASLGLNVNSTAVIIGAMLISPLMGPIIGIGFSIGISRPELLKTSIQNYLFATLVGLATSFVFFQISPLSEAHSEILARTSPNIYDVFIAFFGGCAGMIANGSKLKGNVIPGVAIATALMPPLCTAGFGLATGQMAFFFGAMYLYIINTVFIAAATILVVKVLNFPLYHFTDEAATENRWRKAMWGIILVTFIPSVWFGYKMIQKNKFEQQATKFISNEGTFPNNFLLSKEINFEKKEITLTYGGQKLSDIDVKILEDKKKNYDLGDAKINVKQGFNFVVNPSNANPTSEGNTLIDKQNINNVIKIQDSINLEKELSREILEEIQLKDPGVKAFRYTSTMLQGEEQSTKINIAVLKVNQEYNSKNTPEISAFLQMRLKDPTLEVVVTKDVVKKVDPKKEK